MATLVKETSPKRMVSYQRLFSDVIECAFSCSEALFVESKHVSLEIWIQAYAICVQFRALVRSNHAVWVLLSGLRDAAQFIPHFALLWPVDVAAQAGGGGIADKMFPGYKEPGCAWGAKA